MCQASKTCLNFFFNLLFSVFVIQATNPCQTPDGHIGECKLLDRCPSLYQCSKKNSTASQILEHIRRSQCGFINNQPKVCCHSQTGNKSSTEKFINSTLLPNPDDCGLSTQNKIVFGEKAGLDEFPWMALLDYEDEIGFRQYNCTGALINKRYVLTAAHCITKNLVSVRLGEYDISKEIDCYRDDCSPPPIDFSVEKTVSFESYNQEDSSTYHDIALVRLHRDVTFSDFIKPICLPTTIADIFNPYIEERLIVAGWGKTETGLPSNIKLKVSLLGMQCKSYYNKEKIRLDAGQICAGGGKKDSCAGDSGGPLMYFKLDKNKDIHAVAVGVLSFGTDPCGNYIPGVYTNVAKYMYWILDNMES